MSENHGRWQIHELCVKAQKADEQLGASMKARASLEQEHAELLTELRGAQVARVESDRRRTTAEHAKQDALTRQSEADKQRLDATEGLTRFQVIVWVL